MAYNALNNLIDAYIYANGVQAITGKILNGVLKQMVSQLGSGYHLMGVAGPETVPASNDYAMAYFAATAGEYTDFGGITLAAGEVAVLLTSGNGSWSKQTIYTVPTTTEDLENTAGFITNAVTDLVNYYTKTEVDTTLADYPTLEALATALADYYTKQEVDTVLDDYATKDGVDETLEDYYTKDEVDAELADRYTKQETDTKLADYYKKTETYDKDEVDSLIAALSRQEYIVAWDGLAAPDVSAIPAGVTVTYNATPYTGTLAASASTVNKIYMVWNGVAYDMYGTSQDGGYSWVPMGTTSVDLSQYATKAEVSQLRQKVDGLDNAVYGGTIQMTSGKYYYISSASVGSVFNESLQDNANYRCSKIDCHPGDVFILNVVSGSGAGNVLFADSDKKVISLINYAITYQNEKIVAPDGAAYLYINDNSGGASYIIGLQNLRDDIKNINEELDKKVQKHLGVNLFDKDAEGIVTGKYLLSDGSEYTDVDRSISDYIPVEENTGYVISIKGSEPVTGSGARVCFYDSDKTFLSSSPMGVVNFTTPADCAYLRFSYKNEYLDDEIMMNKGTTRPEYYPYSILGGYVEETISLKVGAEATARENATQRTTTITLSRTLTNYKNDNAWSLSPNTGTDCTQFPVTPGATIHFAGKLTNLPVGSIVAKFMDIANFIATANYQVIDVPLVGGQYDFTIDVPDGFYYLILCTDTGEVPSVERIETVMGMCDENKEAIEEINTESVSINKCLSWLGKDAGTAKAATLSSGETVSLTDFPYHCYKGLALSFYADITTFSKVIIGKGYEQYRGQWIEIDGTNVVQKEQGGQSLNTRTVSTNAHGLTFSTFIKVSLSCNYAGKCQVIIQTLSGYYKVVLDWGYQGNYAAFVKSDGSSLTNVVFNATSTDFRLPVWAFGDSYFGINQNRWVGCLKDFGYFNYLIDNLAGIDSGSSFTDLEKCLNFGTPTYLLWCLGANDYGNISNAITKAQAVIALCEEKKITPIFATVPNMPERDFTTLNAWVKGSGYRYIDISKAVGDPVYQANVDNWYSGYLSVDKVHPTALGAQAMAMQVLADFPEIMQYGLYSDDTSLDGTDTDQ